MDFTTVKPLSFTAPAPSRQHPAQHRRPQQAERRFAAIKEAAQVLDVLPAEGETLPRDHDRALRPGTHAGRPHRPVGRRIREMAIATLSLWRSDNVREMTSLLDAGKVLRLQILVSDFFRRHDSSRCFAELVQDLGARGRRRSPRRGVTARS